MKRLTFLAFAIAFLACIAPAQATISCTGTDSTKTISVGETGDITVSCSGITEGTTVTVNSQYSSTCLDTEDTIPFSLTYDNPSAQISFEATSMSCQYNSDDRTVTWSFTAPGESISSQQTLVTITSPLSITASFKNSPYTASVGSSVTVILEVSTGATVDITDIDADMSDSDSGVYGTGKITDWNDNTIYSSGSQKTIQKSWTFTAPSAGTYTISTTITSQNAGGDQETTTLTTSVGGGDDGDGDGNGGGGGGGGGGDSNATRSPKFSPGLELGNNTKLQAAVRKVLGLANLSDEAKQNMLMVSERISDQMQMTRNFRSSNGTSSMETKLSYSGTERVSNFMFYDIVPKNFAENADNITITSPGATVEIIEYDPEYLFSYSKIDPGEEFVITYSVDATVSQSTIDSFFAEVYAQALEEVPEETCTEGENRCSGNDLQTCQDGSWVTQQTCQYGCSGGSCNAMPPAGLDDYTLWIIIVAVVALLGLFLLFLTRKSGTGSSSDSSDDTETKHTPEPLVPGQKPYSNVPHSPYDRLNFNDYSFSKK